MISLASFISLLYRELNWFVSHFEDIFFKLLIVLETKFGLCPPVFKCVACLQATQPIGLNFPYWFWSQRINE